MKDESKLPYKFKYQLGQDCWFVSKEYGTGLYRCHIVARIIEETNDDIKNIYRIKLTHTQIETECGENELFDVATQSHAALITVEKMLINKFTQ